MKVFIVAGSPAARRPVGLSPGVDDYVIAADLGAAHAVAWGWPVHLLVGDLDSLPADRLQDLEQGGAAVERAPVAKDETDTELALARALALRRASQPLVHEIVICGATGGRTDHLLANLLLLARTDLANLDVRMVDGRETLRLLHAELEAAQLEVEGAPGDLVSLLPLCGDAVGVMTNGLLYPLRGETLYFGGARGISNVMTGVRAAVTLTRGRLLVIHMRMEER